MQAVWEDGWERQRVGHDRKRGNSDMTQTYVSAPSETWALMGGVLLGIFGLYILALDQGFLLSVFQGAPAFDMNLLHEFVHDARHAAGFPCH